MSNDVLITPASRKIEFKDSSANVDAKIETDSSGNLIITNPGGDISLGDTTADIFVGDGTNNIDIVFEQDGEIRGTSGVTVTLGASGSNVRMATDLNLNSNDITNVGDLTVTGNLTITGDINSYNVTDLDVTDKTITLGAGQTEANSGGSGIVIDGSLAELKWDEGDNRWEFNKNLAASVFQQTGTSGNSFYAASFTRSSNSITTPDIWGSSGTLVLGTSSSEEAIAMSGANTTLHGTLTIESVSAQNSEATALMINGSGLVGTRELGSNAFNSTTIPTNNNQLTNGAGYITSFDITTQTDSKYLRSDVSDVYAGRTLAFGIVGNGTNTSGAFASIEGNTDSSGEGTGRLFFREHNSSTAAEDNFGMSIGYRGGATTITTAGGNSNTTAALVGNGQWFMVGHDSSNQGALIMYGDRQATYVDFSSNNVRGIGTLTAASATITGLSAQNSETTVLTINGSNVVGKRDLGSNAFNSTTIPTNNNQLTNGAGYITSFDITTQTDPKYLRSNANDTYSGTLTLDTGSIIKLPNSSSAGIHSSSGHRVIDSLDGTLRIGDTGKHTIIRMHGQGSDDFRVYYGGADYQLYHEGHKPTYSELGTMAYSNLTGTPTIPTNNNQLTNGAGYITSSSTALDSRYYTESEIQTYFKRGYIESESANALAVGWYTVATNTGDRAIGDFTLWDVDSSDHQGVSFKASHMFGTDNSNDITVLHYSRYAGTPIRYIRIKDGGTYDGAALQVYIDQTTNNVGIAITGGNPPISGWVLKDWIPDATDPGDLTNYGSMGERVRVDLDLIANGGQQTTGNVIIGNPSNVLSDTNLSIYQDSSSADQIKFYDGTTRVGEIGTQDTTWLRINNQTNKNIYTPRYIRADNGFFVDGSSKGINGSGNFVGGTIAGASDANVSNWDTAYSWGNHASAGYLTSSSTQSKYLRSDTADTATGQLFFDAGFDSHPIMLSGAQNFDNIDRSGFYNLYNTHNSSTNSPGFHYGTMIAIGNDKGSAGFGLQIAHERTGAGMYVRGMNDSGSTWSSWEEIWTSGTDGANSGLDADKLDGQHGSHYLNYNNFTNTPTIPTNNNQLTNGAGYITSSSITGKVDVGSGFANNRVLTAANSDTAQGESNLTFDGSTLTVTGNVSHTGLTMTSGTDIDQLYSVTKSITLSTSWQDTGIIFSNLATGSYMVQVIANDHAVGGQQYSEVYTGVCSWYASGTNSSNTDEIVLHRAGHASNNGDIFLRTARTAGNTSPNLHMEIRGSTSNTGASNYVFKFRRLI